MKYYAMINGLRRGPMELDELVSEGVRPETYVWCKGMADWQQAREISDICRHFRRRLHDRLHPVAPADNQAASTLQEIDENLSSWQQLRQVNTRILQTETPEDTAVPPSQCPVWLIILAFIGCLPLGVIALISSNRSRRAWQQNQGELAHAAARRAKMAAGVGACFTLILIALLIR